MRPRAHELESGLRNLFADALRECASEGEAVGRLRSLGALSILEELAAENDAVMSELEQTRKPKVAILNRPELIHFADILRSSNTVLHQLLRAVDSPLAASYFPLSGIWRSYAATLVNLHRGVNTPVALPKPKGHEKYYLPYVRYMAAADALELAAARAGVAESFESRNRDRRFTDWMGLDGDCEKPVRWDFRLYSIDAARIIRAPDRGVE
jgi:hypothetical protein